MLKVVFSLSGLAAVSSVFVSSAVFAQQDPCVPYCPPMFQQPMSPAPAAGGHANPAPMQPAAPANYYYQQPAMYVAPAPTGERVGASRSVGLPEIAVTLPSLTLSTPSIKVTGLRNFVRDSFMQLDSGVAPQTTGTPAAYGPLLGAAGGQATLANPSVANPSPANPAPANPASEPAAPASQPSCPCPSYYYPGNGCADASELQKAQQQLLQLKQQIMVLEQAVQQSQTKSSVSGIQQASGYQPMDPTAGVWPTAPTVPVAQPVQEPQMHSIPKQQGESVTNSKPSTWSKLFRYRN